MWTNHTRQWATECAVEQQIKDHNKKIVQNIDFDSLSLDSHESLLWNKTQKKLLFYSLARFFQVLSFEATIGWKKFHDIFQKLITF